MSHRSDSESEASPENPPFSISEDLIPSRAVKEPGVTALDFDGLLDPPLYLHEDLKEGCGGQLWPAGMVLAKFLLREKEGLRGKTILALALGFLQAAPGNASTPPILITDLDILLPLQSHNISFNSLPSTAIISTALPWGLPLPPSLPSSHCYPDILLAADCVYYEPAFPLLLETMGAMMSNITICWFCLKKRRRADGVFVKGLRRRFEVREVPLDAVAGEKGVFLYAYYVAPVETKTDVQMVQSG
ncbi:MAG: hypothetical protein Q9187_002227 [Circinaria calcarea]